MHEQPAREPGERAAERERRQALAVDVDAGGPRGERILAGRAQLSSERAALVGERGAGDGDRADRRLPEVGRLGTVESVSGPGPIFSQLPTMFCVIISTANVAMPAARPDSRISGMPTPNAKNPPTTAAITSDQKFPTEWSRITGKTFGRMLDFVSAGIESSPAAYAPRMKKPIWPNDSTPELPTNT